MELLPHIEIETADSPQASVIWLHGLGANGHDFEPIIPELGLPKQAAVRFVFPHAPAIPVTINGGYTMPAWYDILELSIDRKVDFEQLLKSAAQINLLIDREIERGVSSEKIVIAGFSQGGAVAIQCALSYSKPLAGLLALSTYFATESILSPSQANQQIPIEIHHGITDPVVPFSLGEQCNKSLQALGYQPHFQSFRMEHAVCPEQIAVISDWLIDLLALNEEIPEV